MSATSEKKITIHAQMTIQEILDLFPHKAQKLAYEITAAGLHCVGCQAAVYETLEAGMKGHGMGDEAIARLVKRLNALLEEESDPSTITITPRAAKKFLVDLNISSTSQRKLWKAMKCSSQMALKSMWQKLLYRNY